MKKKIYTSNDLNGKTAEQLKEMFRAVYGGVATYETSNEKINEIEQRRNIKVIGIKETGMCK